MSTEAATAAGGVKVAILGSGNIGTDLMIKVLRQSETLRTAAMAGIDPASEGLARARRLEVATTHEGIDGLAAMDEFADVRIVFDATSAGAHTRHAEVCREHGKLIIDLTPAAAGPLTVPSVNLEKHLAAEDVNMVTCGGQATVPIAAAVSRVAPVAYAEIVASLSSRSAGPGTRANIDEFTETTGRALREVAGAGTAKAVIVLNPADPPPVMRNTVLCVVEDATAGTLEAIEDSVRQTVRDVQEYVPGYELVQDVQFDALHEVWIPHLGRHVTGTQVTCFLQVRGAGHYLPEYAGNLDIMTSAALRTAERMAELRGWVS
ncbi:MULTISPECIES: acetaldehyde dehydrogenase (acetylating) [unclassified Streptomyces]|uniref:acetaldehyde dehydrogenase (acetylating) n=1 Tax=unclassified Streptomyces TaxID=2593676 RepID=UPI000DD857C2|nr:MULTISPECIES: acetaldehyde dehydrogenase (acetylating) [unclassified Streptomyces]QZZ25312.1 acetaldehyde dehydrogenase (acetylating) [Streptomyces sp. ST1015]QZZ31980.1 acetaldehyde dehydrogenase (acetylating) [Streptomyces sp. ST1015]